ncbi:MAG: DUF11 domain-containing protein [Candidatus Thorarchaeota archaeon]|nr:DUF11 domain-containing protein [Candidatus Thorarchaeota archaeon]
MRDYKHAFGIILLLCLGLAPAVAALTSSSFIPAQEMNPEDILEQLLMQGAEAAFVALGPDGVPVVMYGQMGFLGQELDLDNPIYDGCVVMALASTHGELVQYVFDMIGLSGGEGGLMYGLSNQYLPAQEGFNPGSIFDMIGTEFNLLATAFVNVQEGVAAGRMSQILTLLATQFQFSFADLLILRIDENSVPPEMLPLPFDSIDIFLYSVTNSFQSAVNAVFQVMRDGSFADGINKDLIVNARASAAGLLAVPDVKLLIDLVESIGGGGSTPPPMSLTEQPFSSFFTSQLPNVTEPIVIAAAGYVGEQVVSSESTSLGMASLFGTASFTPLSGAISIALMLLPQNVNVTSITPYAENYSFYDNESGMVLWNATNFGAQSDYVVHFQSDDFPPPLTLTRSFAPASPEIGGSTTVTVVLKNNGSVPIENISLSDTGVGSLYSSVTVTGTTSTYAASLAPGATLTLTYTVSFSNEGKYTFPKATANYTYNGNFFTKTTPVDGVLVAATPGSAILQGLMDGMPYTGLVLGLVGLVGLYSVFGIVRGRGGGGGTYQV